MIHGLILGSPGDSQGPPLQNKIQIIGDPVGRATILTTVSECQPPCCCAARCFWKANLKECPPCSYCKLVLESDLLQSCRALFLKRE